MTDIFYLAPMHGLTDYVFRNVYHSFFTGIDVAISPFINTLPDKKLKKSQLKGLLPENNHGMPVIPQLLGNQADDFIFLANYLHDLGYHRLNWNLGCPYRTVIKRKRGAGLLPYPETIDLFLDQVLPDIPQQLSIKMRLGLNSPKEIESLVPILNNYPLVEIIIHPRVATQFYDGEVNMDALKLVLPELVHPVVYSGDIMTVSDFEMRRRQLPSVRRWMLGRGVIRNPWLPALIRGEQLSAHDMLDGLVSFHDALYEEFSGVLSGPGHLLNKMKEYWAHLAESFEESHRVFKKIKKVKHLPAYLQTTREIFTRHAWLPAGRLPESL